MNSANPDDRKKTSHGLDSQSELNEPVSQWIEQLATSDREAADRLWQHFCRRLMNFARNRLSPTSRRVYDEEDAAISAFRSLCRGIESNRYPDISSRDNLWALLVVIAGRKIANRKRFDRQTKRAIGSTLTEDLFQSPSSEDGTFLQSIRSREPTPALAAEVADTSEYLLSVLPEDDLKQLVLLKLEGYTNEDAAEKMKVTRRTVQRKLERIRRYWLDATLGECGDVPQSELSSDNAC